ncbi:MAG: hypothetical protein AB1458_11800 [Bacteroidota bacterium]
MEFIRFECIIMEEKRYTYKYRPAYGGMEMMIEFGWGTASDPLLAALSAVLAPVRLQVVSQEDIWANDEICWQLHSDLGPFRLSRDTWGGLFLEAPQNQEGLEKLHRMLSESDMFNSEAADDRDYTLKGGRPE